MLDIVRFSPNVITESLYHFLFLADTFENFSPTTKDIVLTVMTEVLASNSM